MRRLREGASRLWRAVTVEPVVVLYLTAIGLNEVIRPNLLIDKACMQKLSFNRQAVVMSPTSSRAVPPPPP